jgi:site-specific recombinase XerD
MHRIQDFMEHLRARHLAPGTLAPYQGELKRFARHLADEGQTLDGLTLQQITQYVAREGRASGSVRRGLTILTQFLAWAKHPLAADLGAIRLPRAFPPTPDFLSEVEEKALRKALKARTDIRSQPRDRALFCLMLDTGIRVAEAAALRAGDVDLGEKLVRVTTKGGKQRTRFLPAETRDLLKPLVARQRAHTPLFRSSSGKPIGDRHIRRLLDQWAALAGINRSVHPHLLRHTFATSLLRQTGNLRLVQVALDHESPKTTAIYAHVADEELRAAIEKRRNPGS